jgi:hypothetical protein
VAPEGISVWNPGFDVTPASLISGIITERGVIRPGTSAGADGRPSAFFDVSGFFGADGSAEAGTGIVAPPAPAPNGYRALDATTVGEHLRERVPAVWGRLGAKTARDLDVKEVGL